MKYTQDLTLSISFCFHDSSIAIANDSEVIFSIEAERFFKKKHMRFDSTEQVEMLIEFALEKIGKGIDNVRNPILVTSWNNLYPNNEAIILGRTFNILETNHHDNHIGTALPAGFDKTLILCSDGGSEEGTTRLYRKDGDGIKLIANLDDFNYTGKFYGTIAQMTIEPRCSIAHNTSVGKMMGLVALGKYDKEIEKLILGNIKELNKLHFSGCEPLLKTFHISNSYSNPENDKRRLNLIHTAHNLWVMGWVKYLERFCDEFENICLVGGCSLNIDLNTQLLKKFNNVYVSPVSGDTGQAIGAILFYNRKITCNYPFLGGNYSEFFYADIESAALELTSEKIICWHYGRSEAGARALGGRSFIGLPSSLKMKRRISQEIKGREFYRPVAAMIPKENLLDFFEDDVDSPYMTFKARAREITKQKAPAVVHYDGTTRIQTVTKQSNPVIYNILKAVEKRGFPPIIMNTSLNVAGDPITETIADTTATFFKSGADSLFINGEKIYNPKLISVVIPTTGNKSIFSTIESMLKNDVLSKEYIETIVVFNNKDSKKFSNFRDEILNRYGTLIRLVSCTKPGKGAALNKGISISSGCFIYFTDDDTVFDSRTNLDCMMEEFYKNPLLGYLSGNVSNYNTKNTVSNLWESKGGLSKGQKALYWDKQFLLSQKLKPWLFKNVCAGANCMIPKNILNEIGGFSETLGSPNFVDGLTLEIGYRIAKRGYSLKYNPDFSILHNHPKNKADIRKKLYYYGKQDTGHAIYIFRKYKDWRYLWWGVIGHPIYTLSKIFKSLIRKYPLSISLLLYGLLGNLSGILISSFKKRKEEL